MLSRINREEVSDSLAIYSRISSSTPTHGYTLLFINLYDIGAKDFLEHLSLILMCRETKCGCHHITFVEPARRQIAQHGAHILVFKLAAAQFLQHNVALPDLTVLTLFALYAEGLALAYHS